MTTRVAAVDLGASSGRVVVGHVGASTLSLETVARFPNGPVERADGLHWDVSALIDHTVAGLRAAGPLASIGVDTWAVDYGLLRDGTLLDEPWCYRDSRTDSFATSWPGLHERTGLQHLPFNTIYQLAVESRLRDADRLLLIPDLVAHALTGVAVCERTNASTTGLLGLDGHWDASLLARVHLDPGLLAPLVEPGTPIGAWEGVPVTAVGSHDTASAVVAVPMTDGDAAYVSCGTWGLVGVELERPVVTEAARRANFTNESGVDGRTRFLTNVMGTWLLSETLRTWGTDDLGGLLDQAASYGGPTVVFDVQDPRFRPPGDQPARILAWCEEHDVPAPTTRPALVRSILASLADGFAAAVEQAAALSGRDVRRVHVVGGGAQNTVLCRLLADRLGLPVLAGPVEATALGNVLVQARALGAVAGTLEELRALVARTQPLRTHRPGHGLRTSGPG